MQRSAAQRVNVPSHLPHNVAWPVAIVDPRIVVVACVVADSLVALVAAAVVVVVAGNSFSVI